MAPSHVWLFSGWNEVALMGRSACVQNLLDCLGSGSMAITCNVEAEMTQA